MHSWVGWKICNGSVHERKRARGKCRCEDCSLQDSPCDRVGTGYGVNEFGNRIFRNWFRLYFQLKPIVNGVFYLNSNKVSTTSYSFVVLETFFDVLNFWNSKRGTITNEHIPRHFITLAVLPFNSTDALQFLSVNLKVSEHLPPFAHERRPRNVPKWKSNSVRNVFVCIAMGDHVGSVGTGKWNWINKKSPEGTVARSCGRKSDSRRRTWVTRKLRTSGTRPDSYRFRNESRAHGVGHFYRQIRTLIKVLERLITRGTAVAFSIKCSYG